MKKKRRLKIKNIIITLIILFFFACSLLLYTYNSYLGPVSDAIAQKEIVIEKGATSKTIAKLLKEKNLIKNELSFLIYIRLNNVNDLKYGTYLFSEDMGVPKLVQTLQEGSTYNPNEVEITFQEGINMREIAKIIENKTENSYDDVITKSNDTEYLQKCKEKYWFITDDLDNNALYYKLEGYLFPNTYKLTNKEVSVEYIFSKMLDEMAKHLEPYKDFEDTTLTIHERLTLASMVEKEGPIKEDRTKMAAVFLNRKKIGMNLGSDVTARYANKIDNKKQALTSKQLEINSPYNTRLTNGSMNGKLPVGPISTISKESIEAAFNPDEHNYLYFISNIQTFETFFYENYNDFLNKKEELKEVNQGF